MASVVPFRRNGLESKRALIARAIEKMPERHQLVLSLFIVENVSVCEISKILRLSEDEVFEALSASLEIINRITGEPGRLPEVGVA